VGPVTEACNELDDDCDGQTDEGCSVNQPPVVDAGNDAVIEVDEQATLDATVTDDGQPFGTLTFQWTKLSGPGDVTFADANSEDTTASFSEVGDYVLQLLASDGALEATDTVSLQVVETGEPAIEGGCGGCGSTQATSGVWFCLLVSLVLLRRLATR
jgi:hypothetical protein